VLVRVAVEGTAVGEGGTVVGDGGTDVLVRVAVGGTAVGKGGTALTVFVDVGVRGVSVWKAVRVAVGEAVLLGREVDVGTWRRVGVGVGR